MLVEAITHLLTPCPPPYRKMGYLKELIATDARRRRCRDAWRPHEERTRAVIQEAIDAASGTNKAVVLGAGILEDIPIDTLAAQFDAVELIDICFLNKTRRVANRHDAVEVITSDITGLATWLSENRAVGDTLPAPSEPSSFSLGDADLVISANVLAQLPIIPLAYLEQGGVDGAFRDAVARRMIEHHLSLLDTCPGTICLVTEIEHLVSHDGAEPEREDALWGVRLDLQGSEWIWNLAPRGEISADVELRNRVLGAWTQGGLRRTDEP